MRAALLALLAVTACVPAPRSYGAPAPSNGRYLTASEIDAIPTAFPTTLVPPRSAIIQPMYATMVERKNPELIGQLVSSLLDLRGRRVPLVVTECDDVDAQYDPKRHQITICYEFIANANRLANKPRAEWWSLDRDASSVLVFTALHEIGHALVDELDLRFTGNEEDLVDQFAFLVMTNVHDTDLADRMVRSPAAFFFHHGAEAERAGGHGPTDVHSASKDRAFEGLCLLYGRHKDPSLGAALGTSGTICARHTQEVMDMWNRFLAGVTRLDTGRTFSM